MKKFQEIQEYGNLCKHVEKYDFYGLKKAKFVSSLTSLTRMNLFLFI